MPTMSRGATLLIVLLLSAVPLTAQSPFPDDIVIDEVAALKIEQYQITPAQFDNLLAPGSTASSNKANRPALHTRLNLQLDQAISTTAEVCGLTLEQQSKLRLAGRGDLARVQAEIEQLRVKYVNTLQTRDGLLAFQSEVYCRATIPLTQPFGAESLFRKVLRKQMTERQAVLFEQFDRAEQSKAVRAAIAAFYRGANELTPQQLNAMEQLFLSKYPEWRPLPVNVSCSQYIPMRIAKELEEEIKPVLSAKQWQVTENSFRTAIALEPRFRSMGLWPIPEDGHVAQEP